MAVGHVDREELMKKLNELEIKTTTVEHPEANTIEDLLPHVGHLDGAVAKNLFMRDKKKRGLWLVSARHDHNVDLHDLQGKLQSKGCLRLADADVLLAHLGVKMGSVTPFALINDTEHKVKFILDADLVNGGHSQVYFHPMENTATTAISPSDLLKYLDAIGHPPTLMEFSSEPQKNDQE